MTSRKLLVLVSGLSVAAAFGYWLNQEPASTEAPVADVAPADVPLTVTYAYFGSDPILMPSERRSLATPEPSARNTSGSAVAATQDASPAITQVAVAPTIDIAMLSRDEPAPAREPIDAPSGPTLQLATIEKGDSFSTIAHRHGISAREAANIMRDATAAEHLQTLQPGEQIQFHLGIDNVVEQIVYEIDDTRTLTLDRADAHQFFATLDEVSLDRRVVARGGTVENSLFLAANDAGVSDRHIMQMVDILRWDIDFAMDVRPNDTFKVVYEAWFKGDQLIRNGRLLGVEFDGHTTHRALWFDSGDGLSGYFTPEGRQLQKQFLRNPVDTVRITSPFNPNRRHPVLNTIKAHKGVDYGAPIGTPIKSTGDGRVKFAGRRGSYGLTVVLQHGKRYTTLYAHMNKIHPDISAGKRISQGQVIGYVGKTGRVTGAHLHYEFRIDGVHVNPQTVKFGGAGSIPKKHQKAFSRRTAPVVAQLDQLRPRGPGTFALVD